VPQVPWLSKLSEAGLEGLVSHLQLRRYRPRQKIFAQGEDADDWFLLLHGACT
jgi:CRP-like cAMP-binding protein